MQIILDEKDFVALCTLVAIGVVESELPPTILTTTDEKIADALDIYREDAFEKCSGAVESHIDRRAQIIRERIDKIIQERIDKIKRGKNE